MDKLRLTLCCYMYGNELENLSCPPTLLVLLALAPVFQNRLALYKTCKVQADGLSADLNSRPVGFSLGPNLAWNLAAGLALDSMEMSTRNTHWLPGFVRCSKVLVGLNAGLPYLM